MSKGAVTGITLDSERRLFYRWRDAVDMEAALDGESIETAIRQRGAKRLVVFLWAGLKHSDEKLRQDDVIKMMDRAAINYSEMWNKVSEALVESGLLPKPDAGPVPPSAPSPGAPAASGNGAQQ